MPAFKDLLGKKFGRLIVMSLYGKSGQSKGYHWLCRCDCGNTKRVSGSSLTQSLVKSCGCLSKEVNREKCLNRTIHGLSRRGKQTTLYIRWSSIKQRCYDTVCAAYVHYGGRGITLYGPWINDPIAFVEYVNNLPNYGRNGYSLDRINNNGNYEPGNLRWATRCQQAQNKRNNILSPGKVKQVREYLEQGFPQSVIASFIGCHWPSVSLIKSNRQWSDI